MNPYEAPQTVDEPPKKPWHRHWLWPDFSSRPAPAQGGWGPSLGIVLVIMAMNLVRSCSSTPNTPSKRPCNTISQPPQNSPTLQELREQVRAKQSQPSPRPLPQPFDQP